MFSATSATTSNTRASTNHRIYDYMSSVAFFLPLSMHVMHLPQNISKQTDMEKLRCCKSTLFWFLNSSLVCIRILTKHNTAHSNKYIVDAIISGSKAEAEDYEQLFLTHKLQPWGPWHSKHSL